MAVSREGTQGRTICEGYQMGSRARFESMQRPALWDPIQHDRSSDRRVRTDPWDPQGTTAERLQITDLRPSRGAAQAGRWSRRDRDSLRDRLYQRLSVQPRIQASL